MEMRHAEEPRSEALLVIDDLSVAYGKAGVVNDVSFSVHAGEFVVLLGRNGAGKSTILHAISGLIPKAKGRVTFDGHDITLSSPGEIVRAGLVQVLEGHRVFTHLTVEDNLLVGTYAASPHGDRSKLDNIYSLFPEMAEKRHDLASRLSGGQQQILAVAQGIIANPRLLILDEPSGGLAPLVIDRILNVAASLCQEGTAILLIEQLVEKALRHAHRGLLLETGRLVGEGSPTELHESGIIQKIYLGSSH
jgi:branched-chain amino acid transport system ATP-binding protein